MTSSSTLSASATGTSPAASTSTAASQNNNPTSKPLLFFVALGFGVVFTNLWIIVGVKYCFRYNQRTRQAMLQQENGEQVDMGNMPRPRRKREKKLMSMDEVNERFPLVKYKVWRAGREESGLPAAGGITAPPSRAPSIREQTDLKRVSTEATRAEEGDDGPRASTERAASRPATAADVADEQRTHSRQPSSSSAEKVPQLHTEEHKQSGGEVPGASVLTPCAEEDDPIKSAGIPQELANTPGDQCAICIETLEEDDEVRGLTCGHAFHAGCLDPWLTSRRACCPLCKADYYIPKPRPDESRPNGSSPNANPPEPPEPAHGHRINIAGTPFRVHQHDRYGLPTFTRARASRPTPRQDQPADQGAEGTDQRAQQSHGRLDFIRSIPSHLPSPRVPRFGRRTGSATGDQEATPPTPGELEAGAH